MYVELSRAIKRRRKRNGKSKINIPRQGSWWHRLWCKPALPQASACTRAIMLRRPLALIISAIFRPCSFLETSQRPALSPLLILLFPLHHRMLHQRGNVICTSYYEFVVRTIFVHVTREIVADLSRETSRCRQSPRSDFLSRRLPSCSSIICSRSSKLHSVTSDCLRSSAD